MGPHRSQTPSARNRGSAWHQRPRCLGPYPPSTAGLTCAAETTRFASRVPPAIVDASASPRLEACPSRGSSSESPLEPIQNIGENLFSADAPRPQVALGDRISLTKPVLQLATAQLQVPLPDEEHLRENVHQPNHLLAFQHPGVVSARKTLVNGILQRLLVEEFTEKRTFNRGVGQRPLGTFTGPLHKLHHLVLLVVTDIVPRGVQDVAEDVPVLTFEEGDEIPLAERILVLPQTFHLLILPYTLRVKRAAQMVHHGRVEGNLSQHPASVRVCLQKFVRVGVDEHPDGQFLYPQKYALRPYVARKHLQRPATIHSSGPPAQGNMKLRVSLDEFLDQSPNVGADGTRVDSVVMVQVLQRKDRKEVIHAAERVLIQRGGLYAAVVSLRQ